MATAPTPDDFIRLVERLGDPNRTLSPAELDECLRVSVAVQHQLEKRDRDIMRRHHSLLFVYMADGWGADVTEINTITDGDHLVRAHGRFRHEFLLERSLLSGIRGMDGEEVDMGMGFGPPKGLKHGRSAWHMLTAGCQFRTTLRAAGFTGAVWNVYIWDGAMFETQERYFKARHELFYKMLADQQHAGDVWLLKTSEHTIGIKCKMHGGNNSVDWALRPWTAQGSVIDDTFLVIVSLQRCSAAIHGMVGGFLATRLVYEDRNESPAAVRQYWQRMGAPDRLLDRFCEVDPEWDDDRKILVVNLALEGDERAWDKISVCIFASRRWKKWSLTRWGRAGVAARMFMRSLATGTDYQVDACYGHGHVNCENLAGYRRLSQQIRHVMAITSVAFLPIESFLFELLKDDRLLVRAPELRSQYFRDMEEVAELSDLTWSRLARTAKWNMMECKHETLLAMLISLGYCWREVWEDLEEFPLKLTQGDISANVVELANSDIPISDKMTQRIKDFVTANGVDAAVHHLKVLRQTPTTSVLTEQAHAASKALVLHHNKLTEKQLRVRALVTNLRAIVRRRKTTTQRMRVEKKLLRLSQMRPRRATGKHMLMKDKVTRRLEGEVDKATRKLESQRCVATCASDFKELPLAQQLRRLRQAKRHAAQREAWILATTARLKDDLQRLQEEDVAALTKQSVLNHVTAARLSDQELQESCAHYDSMACRSLRLEAHTGAFGGAPIAPSLPDQRKILDAGAPMENPPNPPVPDLARALCLLRECCHSMAFGVDPDGEMWLFLLGKQAPRYEVTLLQLRPRPRTLELWPADEESMGPMLIDSREYDYLPPVLRTEKSFPLPSGDGVEDIWVRENVRIVGKTIVAPHAAIYLERAIPGIWRTRPRGAGVRQQRPPRMTRAAATSLQEEFGWLSDDDLLPPRTLNRSVSLSIKRLLFVRTGCL